MPRNIRKSTVSKYLIRRLEQIGLKHIFGIPGDYVLDFFDRLEESKLELVGCCNELNAGYAADGYARVNGVSAVSVTYGVGGFSLLNAVVGSAAERLPVIVISGAPKTGHKVETNLLHHTVGDLKLQSHIYREVTSASAVLDNPEDAPKQIDETIAICLRLRRPVYLELPMDMVDAPCKSPSPSFKVDTTIRSMPEIAGEAVNEAAARLQKAKKPVILAGIESHRLGIRDELLGLVNHSGFPFCTTMLGKSILPERHPQYRGVYCGLSAAPGIRELLDEADVILNLGALMTDMNFGVVSGSLPREKMIIANSDRVAISHHLYPSVSLADFIAGLRKKLPKGKLRKLPWPHPSANLEKKYAARKNTDITVKRFYQRMSECVDGDNIVMAGTGDALFCLANMYLQEDVEFIAQAFYLSIGYSLPATLGVKLAAPNRRPVLVIGDGALQMTAQEMSTIISRKLNPVIFIMNNRGYTIERVIRDGEYNDIPNWHYSKLPEAFGGGWGMQVRTEEELETAIARINSDPKNTAIIEVMLDQYDCSESLQTLGANLRSKAKTKTQ